MNDLEIIDVEQGTDAWLHARLGIITASRFHDVLAKGKGGGPSEGRRKYLYDIAAERISGQLTEGYSNGFMDRGNAMEAEARNVYSMLTGNEPLLCGFMKRGDVGCSPDFLVGAKGHGTIKTRMGRLQLELLESGEVPPEHRAQTQGEMWVSGREFSDFVCYSKGLKTFIKRVPRDESYIASLKVAVDEFRAELEALVAKHKGSI